MEKSIDLTGKRFGQLVVEEKGGKHKNGRNLWRCKCDCGEHILVSEERLKSGRRLNCGCGSFYNRSLGHTKDLSGKQFGKLTVIGASRDNDKTKIDGKMRWKCKCKCGNTIYVVRDALISGRTISCGCHSGIPFLYEVGKEVETKYSSFVIIKHIRKPSPDLKKIYKKYICKCQNCGEKNEIHASVLEKGAGSCKACSDSRSFGERFFYWFLKQLEIEFDVEYSPIWAGRIRYDFHFSIGGLNYVVEIDGAQHIKRYNNSRKSLEEVQIIDKEKECIAQRNNHIVIRINCEQSKGQNIKDSICKSEIQNIFNLNSVDWNKCFYMAMSSKIRNVCDLWNKGHRSTKEISEIIGISANYISKMLTDCALFGLCDYNSAEELDKGRRKNEKNGKKVVCVENGVIFQSASECSRRSECVFGIYMETGGITRVCRKERKSYKGFHFEYVE